MWHACISTSTSFPFHSQLATYIQSNSRISSHVTFSMPYWNSEPQPQRTATTPHTSWSFSSLAGHSLKTVFKDGRPFFFCRVSFWLSRLYIAWTYLDRPSLYIFILTGSFKASTICCIETAHVTQSSIICRDCDSVCVDQIITEHIVLYYKS